MSGRENGSSIGRLPDHVVTAEPPLYMKGGVVYEAATDRRVVRSPQDFSMFDGNPGIAARRAKTLPRDARVF
jgi:hypothetical protein